MTAPAAAAAAGAGSQAASAVIAERARHPSLTRKLAARIARELALRPDHSQVESSMNGNGTSR